MIQLSLPMRVTPHPGRAEVEGAELADRVAVADHQLGRLAGVFLVLRHAPSDANWKIRLSRPMVVCPSITRAADRGAGADAHVRADHRVRPDDTEASSSAFGSTMAVGMNLPSGSFS
jgi:hypothetical protein